MKKHTAVTVEDKSRWFIHSLSDNLNTATLQEEDGFLGERFNVRCLDKNRLPLKEELNLLEVGHILKDGLYRRRNSFGGFTILRNKGGDLKDDPPKIYFESISSRKVGNPFPRRKMPSAVRTIKGTSLLRRHQRFKKKFVSKGPH